MSLADSPEVFPKTKIHESDNTDTDHLGVGDDVVTVNSYVGCFRFCHCTLTWNFWAIRLPFPTKHCRYLRWTEQSAPASRHDVNSMVLLILIILPIYFCNFLCQSFDKFCQSCGRVMPQKSRWNRKLEKVKKYVNVINQRYWNCGVATLSEMQSF